MLFTGIWNKSSQREFGSKTTSMVTTETNFYWVEFSDTQVEVRILLNEF